MKHIVIFPLVWSLIVGNAAIIPQSSWAQGGDGAATAAAADADAAAANADADVAAVPPLSEEPPALPAAEVETPGELGPTFVSIAAATMAWSLKGCLLKKSWDRVPLFTLVTAASVFLFKEMRAQDDFKNQSSMPLMQQRFENAEGARKQIEGLRLAAMQSEFAAEAAENKAGNARLFKRMLLLSGTLYGAFAFAYCAKNSPPGVGIGACLASYSSCRKTKNTRELADSRATNQQERLEQLQKCRDQGVNCTLTAGEQAELARLESPSTVEDIQGGKGSPNEGWRIGEDGEFERIPAGEPGSTLHGPPAPETTETPPRSPSSGEEPPTLTGEPGMVSPADGSSPADAGATAETAVDSVVPDSARPTPPPAPVEPVQSTADVSPETSTPPPAPVEPVQSTADVSPETSTPPPAPVEPVQSTADVSPETSTPPPAPVEPVQSTADVSPETSTPPPVNGGTSVADSATSGDSVNTTSQLIRNPEYDPNNPDAGISQYISNPNYQEPVLVEYPPDSGRYIPAGRAESEMMADIAEQNGAPPATADDAVGAPAREPANSGTGGDPSQIEGHTAPRVETSSPLDPDDVSSIPRHRVEPPAASGGSETPPPPREPASAGETVNEEDGATTPPASETPNACSGVCDGRYCLTLDNPDFCESCGCPTSFFNFKEIFDTVMPPLAHAGLTDAGTTTTGATGQPSPDGSAASSAAASTAARAGAAAASGASVATSVAAVGGDWR